MAYGGV